MAVLARTSNGVDLRGRSASSLMLCQGLTEYMPYVLHFSEFAMIMLGAHEIKTIHTPRYDGSNISAHWHWDRRK